VRDALDDDFNTPRVLALLHEYASSGRLDLVYPVLEIFGLGSLAEEQEAPEEVHALGRARAAARAARDFGEADRLRAEIDAAGWEVRDVAGDPGYQLVPRS
jgi:cysteinyl-tRNA synthetase